MKVSEPQTTGKQKDSKSPHREQEVFATPALHSPVPSTIVSSQLTSGKEGSGSQMPAEEQTSEVSSKSTKAVQKDTAKKSCQFPALAHDIELRNRKILMDQQNKVTAQLCLYQNG